MAITLRELVNQIGIESIRNGGKTRNTNSGRNKRVTRKSLLSSGMRILAEESFYNGHIIVFEDGTILYEDMDNYTVFSIKDCLDYAYTSRSEYEGITAVDIIYQDYEYEVSYFEDIEWTIAALFVGMDRVEQNRFKRNYYTPLEKVTYDGSMNYDNIMSNLRIPGFEETDAVIYDDKINFKVDMEKAMKNLTVDQKDVLYSRYWKDEKFQEIGVKRCGTEQSARQRAKGIHDRAINSIRRCMRDAIEDYR